MNCTIGKIECDILYNHLKVEKHLSTVKILKVFVENLHTSLLPKLKETRLIKN